jgi:hypothetical protein
MFKFCRIGTTNIVCYDNGLILRFNKQQKKWTVCKGTFIKSKYLNMEIDRKQYYCHRIVAYAFGILALDSSLQIDHIDRNRINNSISNFRPATQQQNNFNRGALLKDTIGISKIKNGMHKLDLMETTFI